MAYENNNLNIIEILINANADINNKNSKGRTLFEQTCEKNNLELVKLLLKYCMENRWLLNNYRNTIGNSAISQAALDSALLQACEKNNLELANVLITAKANVNCKDTNGNSLLWLACKENHLELVNVLITAKANVNCKDTNGNSLLWLACKENHLELVNVLITAKANVNCKDTNGNSLLWLAYEKTI